ncbi:hypothetical protein ACS0TY_001093 [Phlomoides rotata]
MEGLELVGQIPERMVRQEYIVLYDEPVYELVKKHASIADMREIDGWSRSFYTKEGHIESIMQYSKPLLPEPNSTEWIQAKSEVSIEIRNSIPKVQSLRFEKDLDLVPYEHSSAAGYGYAGKKGEGDNFKRVKGICNALVRTYDEQIQQHGLNYAEQHAITNSTPDIGFTRTQLAKLPSIKVRNVFGEAFHYILIEGLSAAPLLEAFKREDTFYLTGKDPTSYVPNYLSRLDHIEGWFIALDWSRFNATVQIWEIDHAFDSLKQTLDFPTTLSERAFEISRLLFKHRKLAAPDGTLWMRNSGLPSGSYFTNLVGSIINYTRVRYLCNRAGYTIFSCRVQGDDSVFKTDAIARPNTYDLAQMTLEHGWVLNLVKCSQHSEDVTFLGRSQLQLFNIRERLKVLRLMCFPEYEVDDPKISTARVRMIATDAGFRDPLYNKILYGLIRLYGEAPEVPDRYKIYVDVRDFQDINMGWNTLGSGGDPVDKGSKDNPWDTKVSDQATDSKPLNTWGSSNDWSKFDSDSAAGENKESQWGWSPKQSTDSTPSQGWGSNVNTSGENDGRSQWGRGRGPGRGRGGRGREGSQGRGGPSSDGEWKNRTPCPVDDPNAQAIFTLTRQRLDLFSAEEQYVLLQTELIMKNIRRVMNQTGYNDGDPLSTDDQTYIVDNVFNYHPDKDGKMGAGIAHIMV